MKYLTIQLIFLFTSTFLFSQVRGIVIDAESAIPLKGVNITGNNVGTASDDNGEFSINVSVGEELLFSHIGYVAQRQIAENEMTIPLIMNVIKSNEIIVRAGLKDESFQRSTSSVTVIDAEKIKRSGGSHFQDIMEAIPNFNAAGGTSRPRYFQVRGIGERSHYFGEGSPNFSVGFVLDDIDLSGLGMAGLLYDIEQVEVFRGPQSAMFGPNALAGLISMRSADPNHTFTMQSRFTGGTDNFKRVNGMINVPMGEFFALRIAMERGSANGFRENKFQNKLNTNSRKENIIREKLLFKPNDYFHLLLTAFKAVLDNKYDMWAPDNNKDFFTYTNQEGIDSQVTHAYSLRTNYTKGKLDALFILSKSETDLIHAYDGDWGNDDYWLDAPYFFDPNVTYWNYEFYDSTGRNRTNKTLEWRANYSDIVVGYFSKSLEEKDDAMGWLFGGDASLGTSMIHFDARAIYGQFEKKLSDKLKLTANMRSEMNEIKYEGTAQVFDWGLNDYVSLDTVTFDLSYLLIGGKFAMQYFVKNGLNFHGSISRGYKAGGVNQHPNLSEVHRPYDPEFMTNIELGIRMYSIHSQLHLIAFAARREDQQVSISNQQNEGDPNSFIYYTANATTGSLMGLELNGKYVLTNTLSFSGSAGILNTRIHTFSFESEPGNTITLGNRSAAHAPNYSFSFSVDYMKKNGINGRLELTGKDKFYFSDSHDEISDPYQLLNGHVGYDFGKWSVKIWGRNILNTRYATRGFYFGLEPVWNEDIQDHEYPDKKYVSYGDPAHFGLTVEVGDW